MQAGNGFLREKVSAPGPLAGNFKNHLQELGKYAKIRPVECKDRAKYARSAEREHLPPAESKCKKLAKISPSSSAADM